MRLFALIVQVSVSFLFEITIDVGFREDDCRIRKDNAPQNFAILRHISLNLLNQEKTSKTGAKNKRLRAGWDDDYLSKILAVTVN